MIDWTKPVQTRDGRRVRVLCTDGPDPYPVAGILDDRIGMWPTSGEMSPNFPCDTDLINAPEPEMEIEAWAVICKRDGRIVAMQYDGTPSDRRQFVLAWNDEVLAKTHVLVHLTGTYKP